MTPFTRTELDPDSIQRVRDAVLAKPESHWRAHLDIPEGANVREFVLAQVGVIVSTDRVYINDVYQVNVRDVPAKDGWPAMYHLSIRRIDREPCHDWRDFQWIKNQLIGPDYEAVELYPSEERLVDAANQYHLWALAKRKVLFPFGFPRRLVTDSPLGDSVQRPFSPHVPSEHAASPEHVVA